jgi:hypothetical protein
MTQAGQVAGDHGDILLADLGAQAIGLNYERWSPLSRAQGNYSAMGAAVMKGFPSKAS